jgi:DNA-binding transcriptional LysR family regulator
MERLEAMRIFVSVAEARSFAAAARKLSLSPASTTRAVSSLEKQVGALLLSRTTRAVHLTPAGARYLEDCKRILAEIAEAEQSAAGLHGEPRGQITVTASAMFGRMVVAPLVLEFLNRHAAMNARLLLWDRIVDLAEEGIDVAVRIAHLADSASTAIRVGSVRRVLCAAPKYLAAHGRPTKPADLADREAIAFVNGTGVAGWSFALGSKAATVTPRAQLVVNSAEVAVQAAVGGRGFVRLLSYQVVPELERGELVVVLEEFEPPPVPVHVVHLEGRRAAARVRAFVDFAVAELRAHRALHHDARPAASKGRARR